MAGKKLELQKKVSIKNRKASHEYTFLDKYTAGIVLKGTEIKSIRLGKVNMSDAYCYFFKGELYVKNMHISPYALSTMINHEAKADRKLLLTKRELRKLEEKSKDVGLTIIPTFLFINDRGFAKLEVALAKGKKLYDKRQDIKEKESKRALRNIR
ncbi:SsrA-binding protein SmpB [Rapidithrix thailandica]|uniref:SsrA-binding protein n=1 Tax=Rapidithrix thailandica TaxID=413964 RepID=A0AAW9SFW2_9BACT